MRDNMDTLWHIYDEYILLLLKKNKSVLYCEKCINEVVTPKDYLSSRKWEETISIAVVDWSNAYVYLNPKYTISLDFWFLQYNKFCNI